MDQLFISSPLIKNINSNENENTKGKKGGQNLCIICIVYTCMCILVFCNNFAGNITLMLNIGI